MLSLRSFFALLPLLVCLASCGHSGADWQRSTPAFDSVMAVADHMHDAGDKAQALSLVQAAHHNIPGLTITDEIRYLGCCNIIYSNRKDYDRCIELMDSMLLYIDKAGDDITTARWRSVAYNSRADALFAKGLYNDAYDFYYKAQKLAKDNADSCSQRSYSYSLAMVLYKQQRFGESAGYFTEAYGESAACPQDFNIFYFRQEVLDNIGLCYSAQHKYDSAMLYYGRALEYVASCKTKFSDKKQVVFESPMAVVYGNMAEVAVNTGRYDTAKALYTHSITINLQKGYSNSDALIDQAKLADLYYKTGDMGLMKHTLDDIKAELDTIPETRVEIAWNKLMWQYYEHEHNEALAYPYLRAYHAHNEAYIAANKALMATDVDTRVKDIEKQYKINLLLKDQQQQQRYLLVMTVIALMALAIVALVWRNAQRSQKNVRLLTSLNNTVNEQKRQLEVALDELKVREKDKVRILKSVAHDVMNPIAAVISLTDILAQEAEYTEAQRELINLIAEACNNSLKLSNDILEASEEIDRASMPKEDTDIGALLHNTVELLNYPAHAKGQHIQIIAPAAPVHALVYKEKIWRVLNNLIANAIKFSYADTTITVSLVEENGNIHIAVSDKGVGIKDEYKPYIFDTFTEARRPGTQGETPHGLGLSISLQIARAHNGNIWFESEEGMGSTFHLVFPVGNL